MSGLVSIIVPVYNASKVLDRCISSIVNQTYQNWELILVNDGSKDNSFEICRNYEEKDERIILIDKDNGGVSSARNEGLRHSTGEFVCFVDSDDAIEENMLQRLYDAICETDSDIVICGAKQYLQNECILKDAKECFFVGQKSIAEFIQKHYLEWIVSAPWGKIYRTNSIPSGGFDTNISLGEDLKFNITYLSNINSVKVISDPLYLYYDTEGSLTKTYKIGYYEAALDIYETAIKYINSVENVNKKNIANVNYKLFSSCISFMSQNFKVSSSAEEKILIKRIVDNTLLQEAIKELPSISFFRKVYVFALKHRLVKLLYLISAIKSKYIDK